MLLKGLESIIRIKYDIEKQNETIKNLTREVEIIDETIIDGEKIIASQFEKTENVDKKRELDAVKQKQILLDL